MNALVNGTGWNAGQDLKFIEERTQPSRNLIHRLVLDTPRSILDLGCGPDNITQVLREHFPEAKLLGVDRSPDMITRGRDAFRQFSAVGRVIEKHETVICLGDF